MRAIQRGRIIDKMIIPDVPKGMLRMVSTLKRIRKRLEIGSPRQRRSSTVSSVFVKVKVSKKPERMYKSA